MLLNVDQLKDSEERFLATRQTLIKNTGPAGADEAPGSRTGRGEMLTSSENLRKRKEMLQAKSAEPFEFALERAIGKNDAVFSNFIELISNAKKKVGRIAVKQGAKPLGCATGFMVSEQLLLTNWHVFKTIDKVGQSEIQFGYELDVNGNPPGTYTSFRLRSDVFYHSCKELDYCLVAVDPMDVTAKISINEIGYLYLDPTLGKLGDEDKEALNIIHHPDGDFKQLSIRENLFKKITPTAIWYESDTAPGSSGSPVFNDQWQIVALHHMGIAKKNANGEYVDKYDRVIPVENNRVDESRIVWVANEGIRTSVILNDIFSKYPNHPIINTLRKVPSELPVGKNSGTDNSEQLFITKNNPLMEQKNNRTGNDVTISIPASLLENEGTIQVQISHRNPASANKSIHDNETALDAFDGEELKKLEVELDFSKCRGYQPDFLGVPIPLPLPGKQLKKFVTKLTGTDSFVLKYYHYSVIHHSVRMMPLISAINVDGDLKKRIDDSVRKDTWLRDNRIDYDVQLDDPYYKKSGFDRGHMSRREDANWGNTAEEAKRNADLTCMHTNACPQVAALNQSKKEGLWGKLEKLVLEDGATQEKAKTRKISVFNGPVFKETDPVFKGIQVPLDFYKIILWLTEDKNLKATAFRLSQEDLIGDIDFEELDFDKNIEFKEYQCSIKSLETETGLDFSAIIKYDTYKSAGARGKLPLTELALKTHLSKAGKK